MEFYKKYRPGHFREIVGQQSQLRQLVNMGRSDAGFPHFLLLVGPSGCGKTTIARILKKMLKCSDVDYIEMNGSESRGIDDIRKVQNRLSVSPVAGACRIICIDECHALTPDAQNAALKMLEDTPPHVYFIFCTTDPQKLKRTIRTRATEVKCDPVSATDLTTLVRRVGDAEGIVLSDDVAKKLVGMAEGSPRKALVLLNSIVGQDDSAAQLKTLQENDVQQQAISVARALMDTRTRWPQMRQVLNEVKDEAEPVRRVVLGYASAVLLKNDKPNPQAELILEEFRLPFYDTGRPGLVLACSRIVNGKG